MIDGDNCDREQSIGSMVLGEIVSLCRMLAAMPTSADEPRRSRSPAFRTFHTQPALGKKSEITNFKMTVLNQFL